jgi:hypothetical protein
MVAREVGLIDGGPEVGLRGVGFSGAGFGGVPAVPAPTPNRPDADPERDDSEGVKAPNIAVRAKRARRTSDILDSGRPSPGTRDGVAFANSLLIHRAHSTPYLFLQLAR